jgi:hypothetical protein
MIKGLSITQAVVRDQRQLNKHLFVTTWLASILSLLFRIALWTYSVR